MTGRTSSNDGQYGVIYTRFGYFLSDAISIEPELSLTVNDATAPVFVGALHASLHYLIEEKLGVFFSGGTGLGNSLPVGQTVVFKQTEDADVKTFIFGGGIKYYLTQDIAFRNELRYQIWNWKMEYEDYDYDYETGRYMYFSKSLDYSKKDLMFLMGFTVIL